jgi:hypothetical protein
MAEKKLIGRASDYLPPAAFAAFTVIGALYIIVAKTLNADALWVTAVPILLMTGYSIAIYFFRRLRLRDDQTGDNFYYMGFIFTLTSLAVSLVQYGTGGGVDEIVRNFGVAVSSTIAGIVFRILFNLTRRDPVEIEHLSRLELSDAARRVRHELDGISLEMAHFRRTNQQMLAEGFEEIRKEVETSSAAAAAAVERMAAASEARIAAASPAGASEDIQAELAKTVAALRAINASLVTIGETSQLAAERFGRQRRFGAKASFWRRLLGMPAGTAKAERPVTGDNSR